jgi:hypothetical protein
MSGGRNTDPMSTERAPSGVTKMAGANAYAAKLKISPRTTTRSQLCDSAICEQSARLTCDHARPPSWVLHVRKTLAIEAVFLCRGIKTLCAHTVSCFVRKAPDVAPSEFREEGLGERAATDLFRNNEARS